VDLLFHVRRCPVVDSNIARLGNLSPHQCPCVCLGPWPPPEIFFLAAASWEFIIEDILESEEKLRRMKVTTTLFCKNAEVIDEDDCWINACVGYRFGNDPVASTLLLMERVGMIKPAHATSLKRWRNGTDKTTKAAREPLPLISPHKRRPPCLGTPWHLEALFTASVTPGATARLPVGRKGGSHLLQSRLNPLLPKGGQRG
jgi:hypothetical protein